MDLLVGDLVSFLAAARLELEEHSLVTQQKASLLHFTYHNIYSMKTRNNIWQL